jgi:hypothetical protein
MQTSYVNVQGQNCTISIQINVKDKLRQREKQATLLKITRLQTYVKYPVDREM